MSKSSNVFWMPGIRWALVLAALVLAVSASSYAAEPIKIGLVFSLSPPGDAASGAELKKGFEIAREIIEAEGGILGRPIEFVIEDSQGVPEKGRAAVEKLITRDKVAVVTGEHHSSVGLAEIEVAHQYNIPYVNTNCWADDMRTKGYSEVFSVCLTNSMVGKACAEVIAAMKVKKVVGFAENTDYGLGKAKDIKAYLKTMSPNTDFSYVVVDRSGKDFLPAVLPLKNSPPDMVVNITLMPAAFILMNQLHEQGVAPTKNTWLFDSVGVTGVPDFWDNVSEAARYTIGFGLFHPDIYFTDRGKKLRRKFNEREGRDPNMQPLQAADSLFVIAAAIKQAGSDDPAKVIEALKTVKTEGTRGEIGFNSEPGVFFQQLMNVPYVFYQITDVNQAKKDHTLIVGPGMAPAVNKLVRPGQ